MIRAFQMASLSYEMVQQYAQIVRSKLNVHKTPLIGLVCGSGLGAIVNRITDQEIVHYSEIPGLPVSTVVGHVGQFVFGYLEGKSVICMQGRVHYYEGYDLHQCTLPIRIMGALGIKILIVTNAAGGLNPSFKVGDLMVIKDHVNMLGLAGISPLRGPNDDRFGPRFLSVHDVYDRELRNLAWQVAKSQNILDFFTEGVYAMVGGPQYETPAELRLLQILKVDAVGMSTVHEALVARHDSMKVFGLSLISDKCSTELDHYEGTNHLAVVAACEARSPAVCDFVAAFVKNLQVTHEEAPPKG